jgi:hypothetical protein
MREQRKYRPRYAIQRFRGNNVELARVRILHELEPSGAVHS